jgi:hypothetical protein
MSMKAKALAGVAMAAMVLSQATLAATDVPSAEEMWLIIQEQREEIENLKARIGDTEERVEATADAVEESQLGGADEQGWWQRTHIEGYGELHYNTGDQDRIDVHRFVIGIGHDFNDDLRLVSELEVEHALAGEGQPGEVEVEQAYVEYDISNAHRVKGGVFLIPTGIINETHEPPTFYGVERNNVEAAILPSTWWEAGVAASGELGEGFAYDVALHSGLAVPVTGSSAYKIRNGRQKVANATLTDGAVTGRLVWAGMPGVRVGISAQYQDDLTQNASGLGTSATMIEAHTELSYSGFGLRAIYARWDLDDGPPITGAGAFGRDEQYGWYVEPSYRFDTGVGDLGFFARFSRWDNEAGNAPDSAYEQYDVGLSYWPHPDVVLKLDGSFVSNPPGVGKDDNRLNLGIGYQF